MQRDYTIEDVKRYREEHSCSVFEAKARYERLYFLSEVQAARSDRDFSRLCDAVENLISYIDFRR